jgi:hypothetical protein
LKPLSFGRGGNEMNLLRSAFLLCLVFAVSIAQTTSGSQTKTRPDLSGVWALDESRSEINTRLRNKEEDYVLTIVHKEPEIRLTKTYKQYGRTKTEESIYYTDGRPEYHSRTGKDSEPVTRWRGNKLVRKAVTAPHAGISGTFPPVENVMLEEFEISADGKTLTRTITHSGVVTIKLRYVFNRVS